MKNTLKLMLAEIGVELDSNVEHLQLNITELKSKTLLGVVFPKNKLEVEKVIQIANKVKIVVYPYSSGMNWGQGSKVPTCNNTLLVDLSGLNSIIEINEKHRFAIIEPGVTQEEMFEALKETKFKIPVTGSAKKSSIVGNMLERGATFFGHRNRLLMGVEAVLGNESTIRTGLWHFLDQDKESIIYHSQGLGADLNGLFTQSNFGIITKMVIQLVPKLEGYILHAEAKEENLIQFVDVLQSLWKDKITQDGVLITNKNDPRTTIKGNYLYTGDWLSVGIVSGASKPIINALIDEAKRRLSPICYHVDFLPTDGEDTNKHPFFSVLNKLYHGEPTNYSLQTMAQMTDVDLQSEEEMDQNINVIGFSVVLPAVPFDGEQVWRVMQTVKKVSDELGVEPFHNFGSIGDNVFEGFYRIYFDRKDTKAIAIAHEWNEKVHIALANINIFPYRINIDRMDYFTDDSNDTYWQTIRKIKLALDPNGIIALGKYCPV